MKNKEFYADKIIEIAIRGSKIGVDENTRRPFCCSSRCCDECIEYVGYCDEDRLKEWANAEYIEPFDKDEVVLTRNSKSDKWIPSHYAYYQDGRHWVYADGCSSLTVRNISSAIVTVNYIIKYDRELVRVWGSSLACDCEGTEE